MGNINLELETARARLVAAEAASRVDHAQELRGLRRDLAYLEERAAEARFDSDPLNAALVEAIKVADIDVSVFADAVEQLDGIAELKRVLNSYGYSIERTA